MRAENLSFAAIASKLGLKRSRDAFEAFHRALNSSPATEKPILISDELKRLSSLEARIRSRDEQQPAKMNHRLEALEQMRVRLAHSHPEV